MAKDLVILFNIKWVDGKAVDAKPVPLKKAAAKNVINQIDPNNRQPEWCTEANLAVHGLTVKVEDEKPAKKTVEAKPETAAKDETAPPVNGKPVIKSVEETEKK